MKFTHKGEVFIKAEADEDMGENIRIRFFVKDTGIGIPVQDQSRIFERFYRVDKGRSRELGGTGLGLAIVKHILEAHGSTTFVRSEVNKGSEFSFKLNK